MKRLDLFDQEAFQQQLGQYPALPLFKQTLQAGQSLLAEAFFAKEPVLELVQQHTWLIDQLLIQAWKYFNLDKKLDACLIATGGYGRGELHPYSDIDLLILTKQSLSAADEQALAEFMRLLWDMRLRVGHSVRDLADTLQACQEDSLMMTSLLETRLLDGNEDLYAEAREALHPDKLWDAKSFFEAKLLEQRQRYEKYGGTSYNLEPNIKEGPGGLRDIQTIAWIAKRHFHCEHLHELVDHGFLSKGEYQNLRQGQHVLWRIRYALHLHTKRSEERLLFDYQKVLAEQFGYNDDENELAIEQFMKAYYRTVKRLNELNDMLLQFFREAILREELTPEILPLNDRFQIYNDYIEVTHTEVFHDYPSALLEVFLLMSQHPNIKGVRAATIRLIRQNRHLIDKPFRLAKENQELFMQMLQSPGNVYRCLQRMNRYGVLGNFLPAFAKIIGSMQYDLFHVYTVDQHLLFVIQNIYRFTLPESADEVPLCAKLINEYPRREILYLAALFHDIAKGQGGDHSELGAEEVESFCHRNHIGKEDTALLHWLVENHLLMSLTAQRMDIYDPEVIAEFAAKVGNPLYLDSLYLLTVADIQATNPTLWNSWKNSLLAQLYKSCAKLFAKESARVEKAKLVSQRQEAAIARLEADEIDHSPITTQWVRWEWHYFLQNTPKTIAWHTKQLLAFDNKPIVSINPITKHGGTEVVVCLADQDYAFANTTAQLSLLNMNIVEAQIVATHTGSILETFVIIDEHGKKIRGKEQIELIERRLQYSLASANPPSISRRRTSRRLRHFAYPTTVNFRDDSRRQCTIMEVISPDRPGLLARIGVSLMQCDIHLQNAKIATMGERVEDVFFITRQEDNAMLTDDDKEKLSKTICDYLDNA